MRQWLALQLSPVLRVARIIEHKPCACSNLNAFLNRRHTDQKRLPDHPNAHSARRAPLHSSRSDLPTLPLARVPPQRWGPVSPGQMQTTRFSIAKPPSRHVSTSNAKPRALTNPNDAPVQFSADVVNHLADNVAAPEPSPERQATIDAQIRSRIHSELEHLRQEEDQVREEIERALEKENLDKERAMAGKEHEVADGAGGVKSSAALMGDLEEVRQKIERFQARRTLSDFPEVQSRSNAVVDCYRYA